MNTVTVSQAILFFENNYTVMDKWFLAPKKKVFLGNRHPRMCRFCGKGKPQVIFKEKAHAVPECLGNKTLFTYYECDGCNHFFGEGIEKEFGAWSKPMRTMARIRGKKGVPTLEHGTNSGWRIEYNSNGLKVTQKEECPVFVVDEENRRITFTLTRDPHTPVAVLKALTKMALSLIPDDEISNFRSAFSWIKEEDHTKGLMEEFPVLHTLVPGFHPLGPGNVLILLRRKSDDLPVPYMTFLIAYGNEVLQLAVPSPERDQEINGKEIQWAYFPTPYDTGLTPPFSVQRSRLDLTGRERVAGQSFMLNLHFEAGTVKDFKNGVERVI